MTTVQNTATDPGGEPLALQNVRIVLMTGSTSTPGYLGSSDIIGSYTVDTDQTGHWSANLTPNSEIIPENTWYQVTEAGGAISPIVVPASGGPYNLSQLLVTPPGAGAPLGITGVQIAADGTVAGVRPEINLVAGTNVTVAAADNPSSGRVDVTINATGGGGGGAVDSVNGQTGIVVLDAADVSAIPTSAEGAASGVATLDASGHLTAAQAANLLAAANNLSDLTDNATARGHLGLGSAATQDTSAFDTAGSADTAQANAISAAESNAASTYVPLSTLPLPIASGGTGQATQQAALTALAGAQTAGRYLRSNGTNTALAAIQAADVPTLNQSTTGTAAGLSATLAIGSGGTGQATAQAAINALTGAQSAGKFLRSDGTNATLATIQAADIPTLNQNTTGTAAGLSATLAVASGGTGATTAIGARASLGEYAWDTPAARGLLEYNFPPQMATVSNNLVSGSIYGTTIIAQGNSAVTKVGVGVLSSAATPISGQNLIGLYSISGTTATQIAVTGDLGTWNSQGFESYAFGAGQTLIAGNSYIILLMSNATTPVHLAGLSTTAGFPPMYNAGLSNTAAPWLKTFLYGTSQTALPGSFTISGTTMASLNAQTPWVCLL